MKEVNMSSDKEVFPTAISKRQRKKEILMEVDQLFRKNLQKLSFSEEDRVLRETILLQLPCQMSGVDNVVIFPYGAFHHWLGFKDDPLTAFICIGYPISEKKAEPEVHEEMEEGEVRSQEPTVGNIEVDNRMRQTLILDLNDALISKANDFQQIFKEVTLTRQGKLSFKYQAIPSHPTEIVFEAKSFLQVQVSRLIKFYRHVEETFVIFTQSLLHWARSWGVIQKLGNNDVDGLTQDHIILLAIYFLVQHQVIPSLKFLQEMSSAPFYIDGVNTAFCDDVELVKKRWSVTPVKPSFDRILQLLHLFFIDISRLNFIDWGVSPATGTMFLKKTYNKTAITANVKRRLDTKTVLCIQHIFDNCQNTTRKIGDAWLKKLQDSSHAVALKMMTLLWRKKFLKATKILFDAPPAEV